MNEKMNEKEYVVTTVITLILHIRLWLWLLNGGAYECSLLKTLVAVTVLTLTMFPLPTIVPDGILIMIKWIIRSIKKES